MWLCCPANTHRDRDGTDHLNHPPDTHARWTLAAQSHVGNTNFKAIPVKRRVGSFAASLLLHCCSVHEFIHRTLSMNWCPPLGLIQHVTMVFTAPAPPCWIHEWTIPLWFGSEGCSGGKWSQEGSRWSLMISSDERYIKRPLMTGE